MIKYAAKPIGGALVVVLAQLGLGPEEGRWLSTGIITLAAVGAALYYSLAAAEKFKSLRSGTTNIGPQPLAVVVEKSLAERFVDRPTFQTFEKYVHKAHHDIRDEIHAVKLDGEVRGKDTEELIRGLSEKNEERSAKIFDAIRIEGHRVDARVNDVLKAVARVEGAFEQSQRQRP